MDFVNKAFTQTADLLRSMSPGTRIAAGLLLVVIVISLVYLFQYQATSGDEYLLDGRPFSSSEVAAIEAAFAKADLGKSTIVGNRIRIPRGQKAVYLAALADNNALPADFYKYLDEATAGDSPFASTRSIEMKRWNAKQKELALILSRMRGIESATVQYDEEVRPGLARTKQKTAMVAVQTVSGSLDEDQLKAIRNVIASAYAGLERQHITVTDMTSGLSYGGAVGPGGMPDDESQYASHKLRHERAWQAKIADQLKMIPGVIVGVNVELSPEIQHTTQSVKLDTKPFAISSSETSKESTTQRAGNAGRPGAVPNGVGPGNNPIAVASAAAGAESTTTETNSQVQNLPGHEQVVQTRAPLVPTKVTASIEVPRSYITRVWREQNPTPAGQPAKEPDPADLVKIETDTKASIQETVRTLLPPVAEGTNPFPHINVAVYTDLPSAPIAAPSLAVTAGTWLADNWRTLAMVGLGLVCLVMLRGLVRVPSTRPAPASSTAIESAPRIAATPEADEDEMPEPAAVLRKRFQSGGPDLRTELRELVKENPDAAANILRSWIGDAA